MAAKKKTNTKKTGARSGTAKKKTTGRGPGRPSTSGRGPGRPSTSGRSSAASRKRAEAARRHRAWQRRQALGVVCLVLALVAAVSYFDSQAYVLTHLTSFLKGTIGTGRWICAPMLAVAGVNLLRSRDCPAALRTVCALAVPPLAGTLGHVLVCTEVYQPGWKLFHEMWLAGQSVHGCGGAVSGTLAVVLLPLLGELLSVVLLIALLAGALIGTFHISPASVADQVRVRHEALQEQRAERAQRRAKGDELWMAQEERRAEERRTAEERRAKKRSRIDIPLDDEPADGTAAPEEPAEAQEPPAKPSIGLRCRQLFRRRSASVRTPAEVLAQDFQSTDGGKTAAAAAPVRPETTASAAAPAQPAAPARGPVTDEPPAVERPSVSAKKMTAQEMDQVTDEVSRAIEDELAEEEDAYRYPSNDLLKQPAEDDHEAVAEELQENAESLNGILQSFQVSARPGEVIHGPSVTRYEYKLDRGVKLSRITNLADDIALALGASGVRIAPVPNKNSVVGIEVPNRSVTMVRIREVIESRNFHDQTSPVAFALGKDIGGRCIVSNLAKLPHVLIAGTTGSGKSVCTNSLIVSLLYRSTPEEVRFIMIDPKMVELAPYNGIPHLLIPVVTDPKKAAGALQWAVYEMMKRYQLFAANGVRDLAGYNALCGEDTELKKMPNVVVVIDELADLMLVAAKEVEESICRVAQMGRAAGMHLVIATQRPSSDVITGLMKANIPSRIALAVASSLESRIILDTNGAEHLIGNGDMLYAPVGGGKPNRVQGCFISPAEIERVVAFVKETGEADYSDEVMKKIEEVVQKDEKGSSNAADPSADDDCDELFPAAVEVVLETGQASVSMLQRRLKLGYSRAARLVDQMEERGIVGPFEGSKPRKLLIDRAKWQEMQMAKGEAEPEPEIDRFGSISDVFDSHDALE